MSSKIKFRRTTKAIAAVSTEIPEYGTPIAIDNGDGTTNLVIGDGTTMLKTLNRVGNPKYTYNDVTRVKIGGVQAGSSLSDKDLEQILYEIFNEYQSIGLTSLSHNRSVLEVGFPLSGDIQFTPVSENTSNIASASIKSSPVIFTEQAVDAKGVFTVSANGYSRNTAGSSVVTLTATGQQGETSQAQVNFDWAGRIYYGALTSKEIFTKAEVVSLNSSVLKSTAPGDYYITTPGYVYICIPNAINVPIIENFRDKDTGFTYDFTQINDIVFSNGYIDVTYKIFRSTYYIHGTSIVQIV